MPFIDTNILLYAVSTAAQDRAKSDVARQILRRDDLTFSVQVLQEFYVQATRLTRTHPLSHDEAIGLIQIWLRFPVQETTIALLQAALISKDRFQLSYWDAVIIEAARAAGCRQLFSEDLNPGQSYDGVSVINPFAS